MTAAERLFSPSPGSIEEIEAVMAEGRKEEVPVPQLQGDYVPPKVVM